MHPFTGTKPPFLSRWMEPGGYLWGQYAAPLQGQSPSIKKMAKSVGRFDCYRVSLIEDLQFAN